MDKVKNVVAKTRELIIGEENVTFRFLENDAETDTLSLKIGPSFLSNFYFRSLITNEVEVEVEYAINYIEDELSYNRDLLSQNDTLYCSHPELPKLLNTTKNVVSRDEVEHVFNRYADCITGEPATILDINFTKYNLALILTIREIMYHLGFTSVKLA